MGQIGAELMTQTEGVDDRSLLPVQTDLDIAGKPAGPSTQMKGGGVERMPPDRGESRLGRPLTPRQGDICRTWNLIGEVESDR